MPIKLPPTGKKYLTWIKGLYSSGIKSWVKTKVSQFISNIMKKKRARRHPSSVNLIAMVVFS